MKIISLPRLRLSNLQTLTLRLLEFCKGITQINEQTQKVEACFAPFSESMTKEEASAADKQELDKVRDNLISGFFRDVSAELHFPHELPETVTAVSELHALLQKYGGRMIRQPLDMETATVINLLTEVEQLNLTALNGEGLLRWPPLIKEANNKFIEASNTYISDTVESAELEAASKLAPTLIEAIEDLFKKLYAHVLISEDSQLTKLHTQLEELVESFK